MKQYTCNCPKCNAELEFIASGKSIISTNCPNCKTEIEISPSFGKNKCIYCNSPLAKRPKRKTKCQKCGRYIYVRSGKLVTEKEKIFIDAKERLSDIGYKGLRKLRNLDDLWGYLNDRIMEDTKKGNIHGLSSTYLHMGIISFDEKRYGDCIMEYMLCSHFAGMSYMMSSPVEKSIKMLSLKTNSDKLGKLATNLKLSLDKKIRRLNKIISNNP